MYALVLMIVGIGFIAILTGAIAERFLATQVEEAVESDATQAELLDELREIRSKLARLETRLRVRTGRVHPTRLGCECAPGCAPVRAATERT